jgi:uncharacterized protein
MTTILTTGLGLKPEYFDAALACRAAGLWFEVHPENYMVNGGPRLAWLETIRAIHPISMHGVGLSLGAATGLNRCHLDRLIRLIRRFEPALVSEHLAWSGFNGAYFPDLLPLPRTNQSLACLAANIDQTQEALGRRIAIENPAHYLRLEEHDWDEVAFLSELCRRTGCGLLIDVNNVFVGARNLGYSATDYLRRVPGELVMEIHVAGHTADPVHGAALLIDSHDMPVSAEVWDLYAAFVARIGPKPTLIERDGNLPSFETLLEERDIAERRASPQMACVQQESGE